MSFLDRWVQRLGYALAKDNGPQQQALPEFVLGAGAAAVWSAELADPSIYANQAARYQKSWLCYACVRLIAESGARAKFQVSKNKNGEAEAIADHPLVELLHHPNPFTSQFELFESTLASLELTGNAYWYLHLEDGADQPSQIWVMRPDRTQPIPDKDKFISGYKYSVNMAKPVTFKPEEIVHFKRYHPLKDYEGLSPIEAANYAMATDIAAETSSQSFYENAMRVSAVLESEREQVDPRQRRMIERYFKDTYTNPKEAYKPLFLWGGWKYQQLSMTPRDAEYVEGRKLNRTAIFAVYGVHPGLVLAEDVNLANALVAERVFAQFTMQPKLSRIAQRVNLEVMPLYGDEAEFGFVDVVPRDNEFDLQKRASYLDRAVYTINEVRQMEGLGDVEGGDVSLPQYLVQIGGGMPQPGGLSLPAKTKVWALIGNGKKEEPERIVIALPEGKEVVEAERSDPFQDYP